MLEDHKRHQSVHLQKLLEGELPEELTDHTAVLGAAILENRPADITAKSSEYIAWDALLAVAITFGSSDEIISKVWQTATYNNTIMGIEVHYDHRDAPVLADNNTWFSRPLVHDSAWARYMCCDAPDTVVEYSC